MNCPPPVTRLAPTPNGHTHLGNLLNFATTWAMARHGGGKLWLRLDDSDVGRVRPEYVEDLLETLAWLGLVWDEGPFRQSTRTEVYRLWLHRFPGYACTCSRKEIAERTGGSVEYDGHCRDKGIVFRSGVNQWRFRAQDPGDDQVLWRREDLPGYHLASVVDDLEYGINLIVRGEDLRETTRMQLLMAQALGEVGRPFREARFVHHPLLKGPDGEKLSKSLGSESVSSLRRGGMSPGDVWELLSRRAGWPLARSLGELRPPGLT